MSLCEVKLEVLFKSAFGQLTCKYPGARIMVWCNAQTHLYEFHSGDEGELEQLEAETEAILGRYAVFKRSRTLRFLSTDCDCGSENVSTILQDEQCWYVQPLVFEGGRAHYRVICPDRESIRNAVRKIRRSGLEVDLTSMRDFNFETFANEMFLSPSNILTGLTSRQLGALAEAFSQGYFDEPSRVDMDDLAKRANLSRSTYSEHLRKAEAKLLTNLAPFIRMAVEDPT